MAEETAQAIARRQAKWWREFTEAVDLIAPNERAKDKLLALAGKYGAAMYTWGHADAEPSGESLAAVLSRYSHPEIEEALRPMGYCLMQAKVKA